MIKHPKPPYSRRHLINIELLLHLRENGVSGKDIAARLGIHRSSVSSVLKKFGKQQNRQGNFSKNGTFRIPTQYVPTHPLWIKFIRKYKPVNIKDSENVNTDRIMMLEKQAD